MTQIQPNKARLHNIPMYAIQKYSCKLLLYCVYQLKQLLYYTVLV